MKIALLGTGYWGANLLRNFWELSPGIVKYCGDVNPERLKLAGSKYPGVKTVSDYKKVIRDPEVDSVVMLVH